MRQTLLLIPHEIAGLTVFGFGWALILLFIGLGLRLAIAHFSSQQIPPMDSSIPEGQGSTTVGETLANEGIMWLIGAAVIAFVLPRIELLNIDGQPIGTAIRGYGFMLLLGVSTSVLAAAYRARKAGMSPEAIFGLAPWTFIGGIAGARLFYVIQYREVYLADTWSETIGNALAFTGGGLVVYGGFIGGFIASSFYLFRNRLPLLKLGDVIVPCIFIGLMFGRIGCLMNGCCYGGRCEAGPTAIEFPTTSVVYKEQLASGELAGLSYDEATFKITEVQPDSLADVAGIQVGQTVDRISIDSSFSEMMSRDIPADQEPLGLAASIDNKIYRWSPDDLPDHALPVRAAQVISSSTGAVMACLLWGLSGYIRRDGILMFIGFAGYAVVRFGLEWVRVDEGGQFGTDLSISQWVSVAVFICSIVGLFWLGLRQSSHQDSGPDTLLTSQ